MYIYYVHVDFCIKEKIKPLVTFIVCLPPLFPFKQHNEVTLNKAHS